MRRFATLAAGALFLAATGCGHKAAVTPPEVRLPPAIEGVFPPARSTGVPYETEIWAQFAHPLDSTTVTSRNVTLNQDARLIPVQARWESATRRIRIRPLAALSAGRTHTVTLGPNLASSDGTPLGQEFSWQFRTLAVRPVEHPQPADGTVGESPFVTLSWDSVRVGVGRIVYDVYASHDSAQVANRAVAPIFRVDRPYYLPRTRWNLESVYYWSVTTVNLDTSESQSGPVWRFATLPRSTPMDSVLIPLTDWGYYDALMNEQVCFGPTFVSSANRYRAAFRWDLRPLGPRKLARAEVEVVIIPGSQRDQIDVYPSFDYWPACDIRLDGPPHIDSQTLLARGRVVAATGALDIATDALIAHLEASMRRTGFHGYVVMTNNTVSCFSNRSALKVVWYR